MDDIISSSLGIMLMFSIRALIDIIQIRMLLDYDNKVIKYFYAGIQCFEF